MSVEKPEKCNCNEVRRAARHLSRFYDMALAPVGLRATQHTLLRHLADFGPSTMAQLAQRMAMDRATMGHNLRPLERDGLLKIAIDDNDRRSRAVSITSLGRERLRQARPFWRQAQSTFEAAVGVDVGKIHALMERIVNTPLFDREA
ncbi:MarR family winged helix-turn-helix transcriptional regulator [Bradyrhizobium genosp. P]|uniref:MarR family winged helix-turn-helix transcriptional regulator n=1 Tax=Bradyrhizobium genosp. P TaxID=83641 RepID=UPI003CF96B3E